jgi:soluble lytic murein transglycosylase-like protein
VISRRSFVRAAPLALLASTPLAFAGAQAEEPIADAALNALRMSVGAPAREYQKPPDLVFRDLEERLAYLRWLGAMNRRLTRWMNWELRKDFLQTVWYESHRAALDPALVLGLVQVESNFNKFAVSRVGARGYMQVMPFWTKLISGADPAILFHMQTNLRFGCSILRYYLLDRENGDLYFALGRYNGSRGQPQYPRAVLNAKRVWDWKDSVQEPQPTLAR